MGMLSNVVSKHDTQKSETICCQIIVQASSKYSNDFLHRFMAEVYIETSVQ